MVSDAASGFQSQMSAHATTVHINHFATDVTYTVYNTGVSSTIQAIVLHGEDVANMEYDDGRNLVEEVHLLVATSQLSDPQERDVFSPDTGPAAGRSFIVTGSPEDDGHGVVKIVGVRTIERDRTTGNYYSNLR